MLVLGVQHNDICVYCKKITKINLVNSHHHTVRLFFSCDEAFKIYLLNTFNTIKPFPLIKCLAGFGILLSSARANPLAVLGVFMYVLIFIIFLQMNIFLNRLWRIYALIPKRKEGGERGEERERDRETDINARETSTRCLLYMPRPGTKPATQAHVLTGN